MNSLFTKLKQQLGFLQNDANAEEKKNVTNTVLSVSQNQDEDYMLISVTQNEQTSLSDANKIHTSEQVLHEIPTYRDGTFLSEHTMCDRVDLLKSGDLMSIRNQVSPLSDVPFKLHPILNAQLQAKAIFHELNLEPHSFDWSKFSHDFMNEKSCLRDMNSYEIADFGEFILPPVGFHQSNEFTSRRIEVNLMQF